MSRGHCWAACRNRPCRSGRGRCSGLVAARAATRCARDTTRWDCRAAARWGRPFPPPRKPSLGRQPAAAVFGTEMPQRSFHSSLFVVAEYHRRPRRRPWTPVVAVAIALTNFAPPGNAPPGTGFHETEAFDAAHRRQVGPFTPAYAPGLGGGS